MFVRGTCINRFSHEVAAVIVNSFEVPNELESDMINLVYYNMIGLSVLNILDSDSKSWNLEIRK